jgi:hypothetical protein
MTSTKRQARVAGLWYLLLALTAPIGLVIVPSRVIVPGDATTTSEHLRASESLVRIGMASELVHQVICIFLVLALYRLFKTVSQRHAVLLVVLGALVSVPIVFVNVLNEVAALVLARGTPYLTSFDATQRDALAYLFMHLHEQGIQVVSVFWGLWLFPFGTLVVRCGSMPKALGVVLIVAGAAYLATSFAALVVPHYQGVVETWTLPAKMGELPMVVWLVIWGAWEPKRAVAAA